MIFGGYPAVVLAEDVETKRAVLKGDLRHLHYPGCSRILAFFRRFQVPRHRACPCPFSLPPEHKRVVLRTRSLYAELRRILSALCETYVLLLLRPFCRNPRTELRKTPKVYFYDPGLRDQVFNSFQPLGQRTDTGALAENHVLMSLVRLFGAEQLRFWRTFARTEVDFVLTSGEKPIPIEVRYPTDATRIPRALRSFIEKYQPDRALVVTRYQWGEARIGKTRVFFVPACYL